MQIAACGLVCSDCDAYKATQANDAEWLARVAKEWTELFNSEIKPEGIWCDGCMTDSARKCGHCAECEIRACVVERGIANCAGCEEYACEKLSGLFKMMPETRKTLDGLRG